MKLKRSISIFLSIFVVIGTFSFSACGGSKDNFTLYYGIDKMPKNLDPLLASSFSELLTAKNCFSGLYKTDSDDNTVPNVAQQCTVSDNGLKYTFYLSESKWTNGENVTADDFVFAVTRAADPDTKSTFTEQIKGIKGVSEHLSGKTAELGIKAVDAKTLEIELIKPDANFLYKLTTPVFMPCNEKFFNKCGGKYGLGTDHILTNGEYKVFLWSDEKYIKLKRTKSDIQNESVAEYVILTESKTGKSNAARIKDKEIGMTTVVGEDYTSISTDTYTVDIAYRKNYAVVFNKEKLNEKLITALAMSIHRELYAANISDRFKLTETVIPDDSILMNSTAFECLSLPKHTEQYDPETSRKLYLDAVNSKGVSKSTSFTVKYCSADSEVKPVLDSIISGWQSNLGTYISLKTEDSEGKIISDVKNGNFEIAFVPLSDSVKDILNVFNNYIEGSKIAMTDFEKAVSALNSAENLTDASASANKALEILSSDNSVIPTVSVPTAHIYYSTYKNVHFSKFDGTVDFSVIRK